MPAASRLTVSALTGPSTIEQILRSWSSNEFPSFEIRVGFVVIPSRTPVLAASRISSILAVSRKNFMTVHSYCLVGYNHCSKFADKTALRNSKGDGLGAFVSEFIDR